MVKHNPHLPTVALAMIVKCSDEELRYLDSCLASVVQHVDAIYIDFNGPKNTDFSIAQAIVKKYNIKAEYRIWEKNFVKARNDVFSRVPHKFGWILWLDTDDTVETPEKIRQIVAITSPRVSGLLATYDYAHDDYGNVTTTLMVLRLVRNDKSFIWKSSFDDGGESVHESLTPTHAVNRVGTKDFKVIHHATADRQKESLYRNIELLEKMHERLNDKGTPDPRILYYLGVHYFDAFRLKEAREMLINYIELSGWKGERSEAWVYIGLIYRAEGKAGNAENAFMQAIKEKNSNPDPYVELGELCMSESRNEDAELWFKRALQSPESNSTMIMRPQESTYRVYKALAKLYTTMDGSKLADAQNNVKKALTLRPYDPGCQELRDIIEALIDVRDQTRAIAMVGRIFAKQDAKDKIIDFLDLLPMELQDNTLVMQMRQDVMEPKKWVKKSMAIYVGESTLGTWGPDNLKTGIGGSEESVIQLSRLMGDLGWHVVIYGTPGEQAGSDNWRTFNSLDSPLSNGGQAGHYAPIWKHYWEFNAKDKFDVLISWRNPALFDYELKARKKYLWNHDVVEKEEFTDYRLKNIDKVMFVSEYHASLYKGVIPAKKIFVTGNGIDPEAFEDQQNKYKRQPQRMIYMSAHERGLEVLYDIWPIVKRAVPLAKLDVYYGWHSYDAITKDNPPMQQWKNTLIEKENSLVGVKNHGRIGHEQIIEEIYKADVFAYPCTFPEVYCISLIKAMAGGANPVTSDFAVLGDFNKWGTTVHLDRKNYEDFKKEYAQKLILELKASFDKDKRDNMMSEVRNKFSWQNTANGWNVEMS